MGFQVDLDLSGQQSIEQVENMDRVPSGWYRAVCVDHYEDAKKPDGGEYVLEFDVQTGLYTGKKLFYRFKDPAVIVDDEKGQKTAHARVAMLAARLSLIGQDQLGKPTSIDFDKSIGREVVLQVTDQKTKDGGTYVGLAYAGIFPPDHQKIPDNVRKELGLPPARAKADAPGATAAPGTNGTVAKKADDFADII